MPSMFTKKMFLELTLIILLPLLVFGIGGRLADKHFGTSPWVFLVALGIALHITLFGMLLKFRKVFAAIGGASKEKS